MSGSDDYVRLGAAIFVAALLIAAIRFPNAGELAAERAKAFTVAVETPFKERGCAMGAPVLTGPFADLGDVLSVSPLGGVTAPGEVFPAPFIRINTRRSEEGALKRRTTQALAPAPADIIAIERKLTRDDEARAQSVRWTVHFRACDAVTFYYDQLSALSPELLAKAGGERAFTELGGPDHIGVETRIRVRRGAVIGEGAGFNVGLHDSGASPIAMARPERYNDNPYARAVVFDAAPSLIGAITPDVTHARCPLDYMDSDLAQDWISKLGDSWGIRRAKGDDACRTAIADLPGSAQGVWYSDAAHNAATTKVSAVALSPDAVNPDRLIFALHGRLSSLTPDLIALSYRQLAQREKASKDFFTFRVEPGRINTHFAEVRAGELHCYHRLRANFIGPALNGIVLLSLRESDEGPALLKIEARADALTCEDLAEPWAFSGNETVFYR